MISVPSFSTTVEKKQNSLNRAIASAQHQSDFERFLQCPDQRPIYNGYKKLDETREEIRVLKVWFLPGTQDLHGSLKHVDLKSFPAFEALSYYWGPPDEQRPITIDGKAVMIAKNVHTFLATLCSFGQDLPVWVDSLCIDQADVKERNHQVTMMGYIYRKATGVQVWIGEADADSNFAFDYVDFLHTKALSQSEQPSRLIDQVRQAFRVVAARPYWQRMWIIQEVVLASDLLVVSGSRRVRWDDFVTTINQVLHLHDPSGEEAVYLNPDPDRYHPRKTPPKSTTDSDISHFRDSRLGNVLRIKQLDNIGSSNQSQSLITMAANFAEYLCTDPRDKIYALHGIASQNSGPCPPVDYEKSTSEVYLDMLVSALSTIQPIYTKFMYRGQKGLSEFLEDASAVLNSLLCSTSGIELGFRQGSVRVPVHSLQRALELNQSHYRSSSLYDVDRLFISEDRDTSLETGDLEFCLSDTYNIIVRINRLNEQYEIIGLVDKNLNPESAVAHVPFETELCRIPDRTIDAKIATVYVHINSAVFLSKLMSLGGWLVCKKFAAIESLMWNSRGYKSNLESRLCTCETSSLDAAAPDHDPTRG